MSHDGKYNVSLCEYYTLGFCRKFSRPCAEKLGPLCGKSMTVKVIILIAFFIFLISLKEVIRF